MLHPRYPELEVLSMISIDVFPDADLPPIRHAGLPVHPQHLVLLGRRQIRGLPLQNAPYALEFNTSDDTTIFAEFVSINDTIYRLILLYDHVRSACRLPTIANWQLVLEAAATPPPNVIPIPAVWVVSTAYGDADQGGVVECIVEITQQRLYAELQRLVALDRQSALFTATVLGQAEGGHV